MSIAQVESKTHKSKVVVTTEESDVPMTPTRHAKFLIKSRMGGNRQLFWNENIGSDQFRVRIQDPNPVNKRAWWTYDHRTRTVRSTIKKSYVLSNQAGQGYKIGKFAVLRKYTGETFQKLDFYNCEKRTIRNKGGKCLDIAGGANRNGQPVVFWNCHNGKNQAWALAHLNFIKTREIRAKFPVKDGVKFMIRSQMAQGRNLFWAESIGSGQHILRIQNFNFWNKKAFWTFDTRTRTIRAASNRRLVISNQEGTGYAIGRNAVARNWKGEASQKVKFFGGNRRNIRNDGAKCLDVRSGANKDRQPITWWNCHNGANQGWSIA
jgi:hypothetical protein